MEKKTVYIVEKFFPPRCPKCEQPFYSQADFAEWAGDEGRSFIDAKIKQAERFPELFKVAEEQPGIFDVEDRFDINFLICLHCKNVTLRIGYAMRQVLVQEEAERLISEEGFTSWKRGEAFGEMAKPQSRLSMLGAADLNHLQGLIQAARAKTSTKTDATERGDSFASLLDPALLEITRKALESRLSSSVAKHLSSIFGIHWNSVGEECRSFLITAEILKDLLGSLAETNPSIDFSPAVVAYSKALERGLLEKIFTPFTNTREAKEALPAATQKDLVKIGVELTPICVIKG